MKKKLFLFATAALVLAGCNNDVTIDENTALVGSNAQKEIAFTPLAHSPKRTISNDEHGIIPGSTFDTDWDMTVSAYDITHTRQFFTGTDFTYTDPYWSGGKYWPLSATQINFLAIAHANANNTATWTTDNTPTHSVQVAMTDNYDWDDAQRDFMYAIGNGEVTQSGNALTFPDKVDMQFKHTQAYLLFNLKANSAVEASGGDGEITITNIKVKGARTSGTATIARKNPGTYADAGVSLYWDATTTGYPNGGAADALNSVTASQAVISTKLTTSFVEMGHLLVVPNMSAADTYSEGGFTSFEISYTLDGNAYTFEYAPVSTKLEAGKKYIYDITFKLHEILVNPSVKEWDTEITGSFPAGDGVQVLPSAVYKENKVAATYNVANTEGTYSVIISGCAASTTYTVSEAEAADWLDETNNTYASHAGSYTSDASGNLTVYFTVTAQTGGAAERNATIVLTNSTNNTQIKVVQAAGPVVP